MTVNLLKQGQADEAIRFRLQARSGTSVLLVEQKVSRALAISQRTCVLEHGRVITSGESQELRNRPEIRKAFLGI